MNDREKLEKKVHDAPHSSNPDKADFVYYDHTGRHIFEMYVPAGSAKNTLPEHVEEKADV